jgi:hypothetical protein
VLSGTDSFLAECFGTEQVTQSTEPTRAASACTIIVSSPPGATSAQQAGGQPQQPQQFHSPAQAPQQGIVPLQLPSALQIPAQTQYSSAAQISLAQAFVFDAPRAVPPTSDLSGIPPAFPFPATPQRLPLDQPSTLTTAPSTATPFYSYPTPPAYLPQVFGWGSPRSPYDARLPPQAWLGAPSGPPPAASYSRRRTGVTSGRGKK